jgi:hypothetical protein
MIGTDGGGAYLTTNSGALWNQVNTGLTGNQLNMRALAVKQEVVYAGSLGGVVKRPLSELLLLNISATTLTIASPNNSTASFDITSNINWTVSSSDTWLTPNITSGSGNATIVLMAQENKLPVSRSATVTVSGGGLADRIITVTQNGIPTGVEQPGIKDVQVYPNPARDNVTISIPGYSDMQECYIRILTITGKTVFQAKVTQPQIVTNVSNWQGKGLYILQIFDGNKVSKAFRKIIVE